MSEPTLFSQGVCIEENTIQSCYEAAIVGKNTQNTSIKSNYTEGNCSAETFTVLPSSIVAN